MDLSQSDADLLTRTAVTEAAEYGPDGMRAVLDSIRNRVNSGNFGDNIGQIVTAPGQYEPWGKKRTINGRPNPNHPLNIDPASDDYKQAYSLVQDVFGGNSPSTIGNATHFYDPAEQARLGRRKPSWAVGQTPVGQVGGHVFYNDPDTHRGGPPPGSVLGQFGFSSSGESMGAPQPAPATLAPEPSPDYPETGSVLSQFGHDINAPTPKEPLPAAMTPGPSDIHATPEIAAEASQQLAAQPLPYLPSTASIVQGMPVIGPLAQAGASALAASAINPREGETFQDRYARNQLVAKEVQRQYEASHPAAALVGNVLGGALVGGPEAGIPSTAGAALGRYSVAPGVASDIGGRALGLVGNTLGARFYGAGIGQGVTGGLDAYLRGEDPLQGGATGALIGAGGVLGGEAAGSLAGTASNLLARRTGPLADVNAIGRDWITNALSTETVPSITAAIARMGPTGFAADLNPAMTRLASGVAAGGEAPAAADVSEAYRLRQAGQRALIDNALTSATGVGRVNIEQFGRMIRENQQAAATPLYNQWRATQVFPTQGIKDLMPRLEGADAFSWAQKLADISGEPFDRSFFTTGSQKEYPTAQSWDLVKRSLDSKIDQAYSAGDNTTARSLVGLRGDLIRELERAPGGQIWKQARQEFADRASLLDQIQAGRDTFLGGRSGISADELREELSGLSGPQRAARMVGMRNAMDETMGATLNGDTTLRNKLLAPNNQEKLRLMAGDQPSRQLLDTLEQQRYLAAQTQYIRPEQGSPTAGRTADINALRAPPAGQWNPDLFRPLSWLPPSWIDALRPSTVLQGGREASYAAARQQLTPILLTQGDQGIRAIAQSANAENAIRTTAQARAALARRGITFSATGPGAQTARRRTGDLENALITPLQ